MTKDKNTSGVGNHQTLIIAAYNDTKNLIEKHPQQVQFFLILISWLELKFIKIQCQETVIFIKMHRIQKKNFGYV